MLKKTQRKTDRRTIYTEMVVKDALLELIKKRQFTKITVASVCRQAEITRATFYLHFDSLWAVLDEILQDALQITENSSYQNNDNILDTLQLFIIRRQNKEKLQTCNTLLPVCQRVVDLPKYRALFLDESISEYIINKLAQFEKEKVVSFLMQHCHIGSMKAEMLFSFMMHGSFAVNKALGWNKNEDWYDVQEALLRFILGGMDALRKK